MNKYLIISITVLTFFCLLALFVSPKVDVHFGQSLVQGDSMLFLQLNAEQQHHPTLDQFMILMTQYGRELVWPVVIITLFLFGGAIGKKAAIIMALVMITLIPIGMLSKEFVARPRPFIPDTEVILAADSQYAYPSGHSMIVAAGATVVIVLFLLFNSNDSSGWKRKVLSIVLATEAAIVCFSRIYVGAHYPLDVVGGILLGVGVSLLFLSQATRIDNMYVKIANGLVPKPRISSD
jgi:undecaprenyl-diphosphatase